MSFVLTYAIISVPLHKLAVFIAVTTAWGPVAMTFLRRSSDLRGEVEPMPAVLPLNPLMLLWSKKDGGPERRYGNPQTARPPCPAGEGRRSALGPARLVAASPARH